MAYIYDLADSELLVTSELTGVASVNSLELPGTGQFLIVTDGSRMDHLFSVSREGLLKLIDTTHATRWQAAISFSDENSHVAPQRPQLRSRWQIALSFAGEDRQLAERLAIGFKEKGISVFYDQFEKSTLLGKDLYQYLFEVYSKHSQYCLVLISKNYRKKSWTMHELKAMQSAALISEQEYILPIRLDDTMLPGFPPQIGYLNYRQESVQSVVEIISRKIKGEGVSHT
jgi:hypothetical protein